ncbi:MAG TPA: helix-turn-helix domain-containing protein [Solirubrobacteraceae bacterium]|nr:helix-turn-helix domain-containing protein [Solirubrobacteraceae bacterium]
MSDELPELLTVDELAARSRESRRTIQRRIAAGDIDVVRLSPRTIRIPRAAAARYLHGDSGMMGDETTLHPLPRRTA